MDILVARRNFMKRLAQVILKMNKLDDFLNSLTEMAVDVFGVMRASLSLLDGTSGGYMVRTSSHSAKMRDMGENWPMGRIDTLLSWMKQRQRILTPQDLEEFGSQAQPGLKDELEKSQTFMSVPLSVDNRLIGVLNLGAKMNKEIFNSEEIEMLSELAQLIAPIIKQALEYDEVSEQRLHHQNILDNLVSGIIAVDPQDKITVFNRAAERILRFRAEQLLGKDVRILQANLANLLLATLHKGTSCRREELYILPENILIGVSTCQFYDTQGNLLGACMVFSNLAKIKKAQELSRQKDLDAYWSNVANSLAHEVKNSIVATKVFAEMFPEKYEDAEFRWNLYSTLKRDMEKLDNFTERVLKFAQAQEFTIQLCQMDKVMDAAINSALQNRNVGGISFEKRYDQNLEAIPGDYHQLKEAFARIIANALEAMGKKGKLSISIEQEKNPQMLFYSLPEAAKELPAGRVVVVKISDTGCGILPENMQHLFDPFFTTKEARTGLSLAFARKIIKRHKGIINAESKPDEGTTFWVCLPVSSEAGVEKV